MKYIALIFAVLAFWCGLVAYVLNIKLTTAEKNLSLLKAEKIALETEVRNYNEKSLQASKQLGELKKQLQATKDDNSDSRRCYDVALPDYVLQLLHESVEQD